MKFFKVTSVRGETVHSWVVEGIGKDAAAAVYLAMNPDAVITHIEEQKSLSADETVKNFTFTHDWGDLTLNRAELVELMK